MTKKEILKCLLDYETCKEHECRGCFANQEIKYLKNHYNVCELFNAIEQCVIENKEDKN